MEIPRLKKIFALIPEELFDEISQRNLFNSNFDAWITEAILAKLEKEREQR